MAVTSYKYPTLAINTDRDSKITWADPENAKADDGSIAVNVMNKDDYGDWLHCYTFGFSTSDIPDGSTIDGIEVVIERKGSHTDKILDSALYLYYNGSNRGDNKASATCYPTTLTAKTYGGAADLWGYAWDDSYVRDSTFGVRLSSYNDGQLGGGVSVDYVKVRVYYTAPAAGFQPWAIIM